MMAAIIALAPQNTIRIETQRGSPYLFHLLTLFLLHRRQRKWKKKSADFCTARTLAPEIFLKANSVQSNHIGRVAPKCLFGRFQPAPTRTNLLLKNFQFLSQMGPYSSSNILSFVSTMVSPNFHWDYIEEFNNR